MHVVESPCREVLFTDIEIEHPTVAKHEFEIVFLNGEKLRSCYPFRITRSLFLLLSRQQARNFLPNQQLKKLKNGMFDCFSWIWYNIIKEGASGMKEKE